MLVRFGSDVSDQHLALKDALTGLLQHPNDSVRKRASITLGPLVTVLDDALFAQLMEALIVRLESSTTPGTYIQSISAICKSAGVKVGPYLPKIVPRLEKFCLSNASSSKKRDDDEEDAAQLELWEQSLQALEAITRRCPNKVTPYVPNIVRLATSLSTYDPLYTYEEDVAMEGGAKKATAKSRAKAAAAEDAWGADDDGGDAWGDEDGDAAMAGGGGGQLRGKHSASRMTMLQFLTLPLCVVFVQTDGTMMRLLRVQWPPRPPTTAGRFVVPLSDC